MSESKIVYCIPLRSKVLVDAVESGAHGSLVVALVHFKLHKLQLCMLDGLILYYVYYIAKSKCVQCVMHDGHNPAMELLQQCQNRIHFTMQRQHVHAHKLWNRLTRPDCTA